MSNRKRLGMSRRRDFFCSVCLHTVRFFPGDVVNKNEIVCRSCQEENPRLYGIEVEDKKMSNQHYGVYALDEQEVSDEEIAQAWGELQKVASYVETRIAACDFSAVIQEVDGYPVA